MKNIIQKILIFLLGAACVAAFIYALSTGMDKQEVVTCNKLQQQASVYPAFYLTQSEKDMCDYHGIKINAPVEYHAE